MSALGQKRTSLARRQMSALGQKRTLAGDQRMSALGPKRTLLSPARHPSRRGCCPQSLRLPSLGPIRSRRSEAIIQRRALILSAGATGLPWPLVTSAQSFPSKPITIVVPFSAGGPTDTIARVIGEGLQAALGQTVIVDNVAGAAVTFKKALEPAFKTYAAQILANARAMAEAFLQRGATLVTGGTENHLMVVDTIASYGLDGRVAEETLDKIGITTNKQVIPDDPRPPLRPSGIRLGTPACTTRGMIEGDMRTLVGWMDEALRAPTDEGMLARLRAETRELCRRFPVPGLGD